MCIEPEFAMHLACCWGDFGGRMAIINGTSGDDDLDGTNGADTIRGRGGKDVISGGNGGDWIDGGAGDDQIDAGNGADIVLGGSGDDVISGGDGNDQINGATGNDTIDAGRGDDQVNGGSGNDIIAGGQGDDRIFGDAGHDSIDGGAGDDSLHGGDGDDLLVGGSGDDELFGNAGDDRLLGGQGNDGLYGGTGDDYLDGGANNDMLFGQDGNDTLIVGGGNDLADGGYGNDTFYVTKGDHQIIGGEDADGMDIDVLDLSGAGNYTIQYTGPESGTISFLNAAGQVTRTATFKEIERVICFTPGTGIATMSGQRPVEELKIGDRIFTRDNGAQEIRWIGRKRITLGAGTLSQKLQPILIRRGALGYGLPDRDMLVSPNHRVLLVNSQAQLYFDENEVLVAAKHLVGMPGIEHWITSQVEYIHFLCDRHEIVLSNGAWTETFLPGDQGMSTLADAQQEEIFRLFPELKTRKQDAAFVTARRTLKRYEAELLSR